MNDRDTGMPEGVDILKVRDLCVTFELENGARIPVVRGVSFGIPAAGCVALVGESGCGKSITCMALTGLPPTNLARRMGSVRFDGQELLGLSASRLRRVQRGGLGYVFQDPMGSLDPVMRVSGHLSECHRAGDRKLSREGMQAMLADVGLPSRCLDAYPCELSGGQQQRVMIAMAMAVNPRLMIADEPTTALDVRTQQQVLEWLHRRCRETGSGWLLVTHNLGLAAAYADTVLVMYAGRIVERGPVAAVLCAPRHPYSQGLLRAVPRLRGVAGRLADIPGQVPEPLAVAAMPGCSFAPRCPRADARCRAQPPPETGADGRSAVCWRPLG